MSVHCHLYRRDDPVTSKRAARKVTIFMDSHEGRILGALNWAGSQGATYREIAQALLMEPVAVARRLKGMERKGIVWRKHRGLQQGVRGGWHDAYDERDGCAIWWTK